MNIGILLCRKHHGPRVSGVWLKLRVFLFLLCLCVCFEPFCRRQKDINAKNTMRPVRSEDAQFRQELRNPNDIHGHAANFTESLLLQPPASLSFGPGPVSTGADPLWEPGVGSGSASTDRGTVDVQAPAANRERNYPCCGVCGHLRFDGPFREHHYKHCSCNTPKEARREVKYPKLSGAKKFVGRCLCEGTAKYPGGVDLSRKRIATVVR